MKQESTGRTVKNPNARLVTSADPMEYLLDNDSVQVKQVRIMDHGSQPQCAKVSIGVTMKGVVDSGSDITILGGEMFKKVASVAHLHKKDFHPPDKNPRNYDQQPFMIDGRIDIDVVFQDKAMKTAVYVKMDAPEDLLLSEGVCRQLGILTYHPEVQPLRGRRAEKTDDEATEKGETTEQQAVCQVPMVRVRLVCGNQSTLVEVELDNGKQEFKNTGSLLFESDKNLREQDKVHMEDALLQVNDRETAMLSDTKIRKREGIGCSDLCRTAGLYRDWKFYHCWKCCKMPHSHSRVRR